MEEEMLGEQGKAKLDKVTGRRNKRQLAAGCVGFKDPCSVTTRILGSNF